MLAPSHVSHVPDVPTDSGIDPAELAVWIGSGVALVLLLLVVTFVLSRLLYVCAPNEIPIRRAELALDQRLTPRTTLALVQRN